MTTKPRWRKLPELLTTGRSKSHGLQTAARVEAVVRSRSCLAWPLVATTARAEAVVAGSCLPTAAEPKPPHGQRASNLRTGRSSRAEQKKATRSKLPRAGLLAASYRAPRRADGCPGSRCMPTLGQYRPSALQLSMGSGRAHAAPPRAAPPHLIHTTHLN